MSSVSICRRLKQVNKTSSPYISAEGVELRREKLSRRCFEVEESTIRDILKVLSRKDVISFAGGIPDPDTFPHEDIERAFSKCMRENWRKALQYTESQGVRELREEIARFMQRLDRGSPDPDNVIVTSGSQEALYILSMTLLDPGDVVIVERPTYLAMLQVLKSMSAKIIDVELKDDGIDVEALDTVVKKLEREGENVKMIYVVPTCQNPTGITMSIDKRKQLIEIAEKHDLYIVEDDPYSYYLYDNVENLEPLYKLCPERVIYCSTFSKILVPGFRVGWIVAPEDLVSHIVKMKQIVSLQTTTVTQYVLAELLKDGIIERRLPELSQRYRKKRDAMLEALETYMPSHVTWTRPVGGMFVWVKARPDIDTTRLLNIAIEKYGVAYVPGEAFYATNPQRNTMRLNFTYPSARDIFEGVKRLGEMLKEV
ncbi:MAG: PLP-dependent aminotransferase family protein [Crenarchaeota archaeon]|nr:PLP-dependent aminotransferase family protein [Thermoproteota archaeon]